MTTLRKEKTMPEKIEVDLTEFENLIAVGKTIVQAAEEMSINYRTLYAKLSNDSELKSALDRGQYRARQAGVTPTESRRSAKGAASSDGVKKKASKKHVSDKRAAPLSGIKDAGGGEDYQRALRAALLEFDYVAVWGVPSPKAQEVRDLLSAALNC
jgi:hypothetical protein